MVLVVAGHVFMRKEFSDSTACVVTWKWIYIFHMPLFIFISGYFSRKKELKDLWSSIWKLLEPLIIFQVIGLLFYVDFLSVYKILKPWYVLWYLLSLIYWRLILQIIPDKILIHTKLIIFTTFCISILAGFLPFGKVLSIQRTLSFMPFFFLGYCMRGKDIYLPKKYKSLCFLFLTMMVVVTFFFYQYLGKLTHADPYGSIYGAAKRLIIFGLAIPMSIAFINVCPNKPWIARQGRFTMQYYIYHALAIMPLMILVGKLSIPMSFVFAVIYTLILILGIGIASRLPYFTKFTNPLSLLKYK